ncbi:unnamed protein product [Vitrella brassicaformis CCMP3155]|uniref:Uncharacterized protein n=2 Tax=Vitrella brassicaformis TaxID=1169539 RepID=A0A0G4EXK2_VITBC|nr:unnamed protein product [Vitrella brassicaformis CCMP3155]|eukprot:CEM03441.1 unnamed protein product [Vitrella brassicaformis CCMP3155]
MPHQQHLREPFPVTLSRGGAPAFALSATKELAFGLHYGSLSPDAAAQLLTQETADPNGRYRKNPCDGYISPLSLLHLAAETCVGEDGAAMLDCLLDAGAEVNYDTSVYAPFCTGKTPLDLVLDRLGCADPRLLSALLPMIGTLLRHAARCYYGGSLRSLFASSAMEEVSATECLEIVTRLTTAAAAAPSPPSLYGYSTLYEACKCRFRVDKEEQPDEQQRHQQGDAAHDGQTDAHIAILEKLVEGMGREVVEGDRGSRALNEAVDSQNRAIMYWLVRQQGVRADSDALCFAARDVDVMSFLIASYIEPPSLPFSDRTPLGRRLNAALSFFISRVCNVASPSVRRRLFQRTAFVTPHITHTDTSDSQGGGEGGQVDEGIVYGLREVIHLIRCEEAQRYELPDIDRGFGKSKPFESSFDGRVVVQGAGGGQCVVQTIEWWEAMGGRGPPGALWGEEPLDDDDDSSSDDDLDEDGVEDGGDGEDPDEGSVAEDGMDGDSGEEEDGDMIDDDDDEQQQQHVEDDQSVDEMDEEDSSSNHLT